MPRTWKPEEDAFLASFVPGHTQEETLDAFEERYGERLTLGQLCNRRTRLGVRHGTYAGRFKKGHVAPNKGKKQSEFMSPEAIERTKAGRFKKGDVPHNGARIAVGSERVAKGGYIEVKVKELSDRPCSNKCWRGKHLVEWEKANGRPVPKGHKVVFADNDKRNFDPDNLVLVSNAEMVRINSNEHGYCDRATLDSVLALVRLEMGISNAEKRPRPCTACGKEFKPEYKRQARCRECIDAGRKGKRRKMDKTAEKKRYNTQGE